MRWRPLQIQMHEEGENNGREKKNTGESFERCTASPSSWWWMCHRWKQKMSYPASRRSPHQSWSSQRRPRPPLRSTKIDRGPCCRISTPLPPMSTNAPLHAWHNLLKQDCLYFLTQMLPWLCFPSQLYFIVAHVCLTLCCCVWWRAGPGWFPHSSKDGLDLFNLNLNIFKQTHRGSSGKTEDCLWVDLTFVMGFTFTGVHGQYEV